jgi:GT2 family glycosyltransferase
MMISVIIANHNGEEHLDRCLGSLGRPGPELEIIVVDNASSDDSLNLIAGRFPAARVLPQPDNLGFAAANNIGAEAAKGDALLLLNNDAWLEPGALVLLADRLESDPRAGLVAPRLCYPDGGRQFSWSPARGVLGEALQQLRNGFEAHSWVHGTVARGLGRLAGRPWYTAASLLIRSRAFRQIGGFDTNFFMYFEDVDLCVRLEEAGWCLVQEPRAVVTHVGGIRRSATVDDLYRPSQLRYYRVHRPTWEARLVARRLRRRFGDAEVERWLGIGEEECIS